MAEEKEVMFDAPIPGQGLTAPVGGRPWQQPSQYTTVEEALDGYYMPKFTDQEFLPELLNIIELGIPLTTIANSFQLSAVMEGKHTIDVGVLVIPVIVELMINISEANDVKYTSGLDKEKEEGLTNVQIALAKKQGLLEVKDEEEEIIKEPVEEETECEEEPMSMSIGLMSRRESVQ